MMIVRIKGGLGNQMFQYSFGRAQSERMNNRLILDTSWYRGADREFEIDSFELDKKTRVVGKVESSLYEKVFRAKKYDEFWEDKAYGLSIREKLLKEFVLKNTSDDFARLAKEISSNPRSVAIHVRRGDFLKLGEKYKLPKTYYENAIRKIAAQTGSDLHIFVFSDDKEWCRAEMSEIAGFKTKIVEPSAPSNPEELILMSKARFNVIANSTFSWWAAFLNQNKDKMIIAPKHWYTDPARNTRTLEELILPDWTVLE